MLIDFRKVIAGVRKVLAGVKKVLVGFRKVLAGVRKVLASVSLHCKKVLSLVSVTLNVLGKSICKKKNAF